MSDSGASVLADEIDALVPAWGVPGAPGGAIAVIRDGAVVAHRCLGLADLAHGVPMTATTRFPVASVTKQMVAAALVLLQARGLVDLDDPVGRHFELRAGGAATLRQCLQMISGLRDTGELMRLRGVWWRYPGMHADGLGLLARQRSLNFPVGERFIYTNVNFGLAGTLIERLTGRSLDAALRALLFESLGMADSLVRDAVTVVTPRLATGYIPNGAGFEAGVWSSGMSGAGAVVSTVADLVRWQGALMRGEIGGIPVTAELARSGVLADGSATGYGLGLQVRRYRGLEVVGHTGSLAGFRALSFFVPEARTGFVMLSNRDDTDYHALWRGLLDAALDDRFPEPKPDLTTASDVAGPLLGRWLEPETGETITITRDAAGIVRADKQGHAMLLQRSADGLWRFHYGMFPVAAEVAGGVLDLSFGGARQVFERCPEQPPSFQPNDVTGHYWNADLDAGHEIDLDGGTLTVRQGSRFQADATYPLTPIAADIFAIDAGRPGYAYKAALRFRRGASGRIEDFILSTERVKGMVFSRLAD